MILQFADDDALRLALTSGAVPPEVHAAPAVVGRDDEGQVFVETDETVPNDARRALRELGVKGRRGWPDDVERLSVFAWPQAFAVERSDTRPDVDDRTAVLFEITDGELLPEIVGEMLRLGNDRQSFRHLVDDDEPGSARVLLKVVGPPYYSLLRALDRDGNGTRPTAYVERAPRVWVEVGCRHPFPDRLVPPPRTEWLLSPPHDWRALDEAPFTGVDRLLDFELPHPATSLEDRELDRRLNVPLRLVRGDASEAADTWVLTGRAVDQLDDFVRTSRDHLLDRLAFAVARHGDEEIVVVRSRPGRGTPPVVVLDGLACRPYLKLPNLFLPVGRRLHPPLRRDTVKSLLCEDDTQLTWLQPDDEEAGAFTPFRLPETAFRPLSDWVDYVLDREAEPLDQWTRSTRFDFDRFVCPEEQQEREKRQREREASDDARKKETSKRRPGRKPPRSKDVASRPARGPRDEARLVPVEKPAERRVLEDRLRSVEKTFLADESEADGPERLTAWTEMARLNTQLGHYVDAAICWTQRIWEEEPPTPDDLWDWFATEYAAGQRTDRGRRPTDAEPFDAERLDELLTSPNPSPTRVQSLAAYLAWVVVADEPADAVVERLAVLQRFLERHEAMLSVRARWLAARALYELSDRDVLALARIRDRTLEQLFAHGTRPDRDLPSFLRGAGLRGGERFRIVRDRVVDLHQDARQWLVEFDNPNAGESTRTEQYVDLVFAFGLAKLGETEAARELRDAAAVDLGSIDTIHRSLLELYSLRVQQALDGRPTTAPFPEDLLARLDATFSLSDEEREVFDRGEVVALEKTLRDDRYKVDRLRQHSRVLEPHERIDAYRNYRRGFTSNLARELSELTDATDRGDLTSRVTDLLERKLSPEDRSPTSRFCGSPERPVSTRLRSSKRRSSSTRSRRVSSRGPFCWSGHSTSPDTSTCGTTWPSSSGCCTPTSPSNTARTSTR